MTQQQILPAQLAGGVPEPGGGGGGGSYQGYIAGTLATSTGITRIYNDSGETRTIVAVRATVTTAPAGASVVIDVNMDDVSIFPTATKPTIPAGSLTNKRVPDTVAWPDGSYLTIDIDAIGSTTPGSNLSVQIEVA